MHSQYFIHTHAMLLNSYLRDKRANYSTQASTESASEAASRQRRYRWWHQKLADYFKQFGDFERKIQVHVRCFVVLHKITF